jgi:hypothetical protein
MWPDWANCDLLTLLHEVRLLHGTNVSNMRDVGELGMSSERTKPEIAIRPEFRPAFGLKAIIRQEIRPTDQAFPSDVRSCRRRARPRRLDHILDL